MRKPLRVLVVDDHAPMRSVLKRMLLQTGCFEVIHEAEDGERAWEKINEQGYDLVICDVVMPRLDGIGLLKRCRGREELKELPFLMISGEAQQAVVASAGEWGAYDYILKPFSYTLLKDRVESIFGRLEDPLETLYREVEKLKESGMYREALQKLKELKEHGPALNAKWINLTGECLMEIGEMDEAARCFEQAMELVDVYLPAYKNYASLQQKLGNLEKAVEALEKADSISPMDTDRKLKLGKLMMKTGREEDGRRFLERAVREAPPDKKEQSRLKVAEAYLESGDFEAAENLYVTSLKRNPNQIEAYNRLGIALRRQGKFEKAERYYQLAVKSYPDNPALYYNLGVLCLSRREFARAAELLKKSLQLDPNFKEAQKALRSIPRKPGEGAQGS